ncbi:FtsW/RodA/SpoVE family cell cycle protein, partial [Breznakia sp. OttesenSCG-928-G09]|nr:FtsW/RodA/SpoVE family cell cycle protein [Breznakia sp. OttesenSCG-928-G09]
GTIQPSEFAKTYLIILMGLTANHFGNKRVDLIQYMKRPVIFFIMFIIIIFIQPDLGTLIVLGLLFAICFIIPSHGNLAPSQKIVKFALFGFVVLLGLTLTDFGIKLMGNIFGEGYKIRRFTDAANPFENMYDTGYNLVYSLYAIANGGITGLGIGGSEQKFGYLPEAQTDFIISVTIEELGLFGFLLIVLCYAVILYRLIYYAKRTKSDGYRLILIGCASYLAIHFILNVGGVSALLPLTGVPLLLISAGGSSMLSISMLLGVCQSIISMTKSQAKRAAEQRNPFR